MHLLDSRYETLRQYTEKSRIHVPQGSCTTHLNFFLCQDSFNNTYRALRFVDDDQYGDLLYAEFGGDFLFDTIVFHEIYNLTQVRNMGGA